MTHFQTPKRQLRIHVAEYVGQTSRCLELSNILARVDPGLFCAGGGGGYYLGVAESMKHALPPPPPNGGGTCPECLVEYSFEGLLLSEVYSVNTITVLNLMNRPKKLPPLPFLSENLVVEVNHISKVEYTHVQMCQEHVHLPT